MAKETRTVDFNFDAGLSPGNSDDLEGKYAGTVENLHWDKEGECCTRTNYAVQSNTPSGVRNKAKVVTDGSNVTYIHEAGKLAGTVGGANFGGILKDEGIHPLITKVVDLGGNLDINRCCHSRATFDYVTVGYDYTIGGTSYCDFFLLRGSTGEVLAKDTISDAQNPKVAGLIFFYEDASNTAFIRSTTASTATWDFSTPQLVVTDKLGTSDFSLANAPEDLDPYYLAYESNANRLVVVRTVSGGTPSNTYTHATDAGVRTALHVDEANGIYVAYDDGAGNLKINQLSEPALTLSNSGTLDTAYTEYSRIDVTAWNDGTTDQIVTCASALQSATFDTIFVQCSTTITSITAGMVIEGVVLQGNMGYYQGYSTDPYKLFAVFSDRRADESLQPTNVLCSINHDETTEERNGIAGLVPMAILGKDVSDVGVGILKGNFGAVEWSADRNPGSTAIQNINNLQTAMKVRTGFTSGGDPLYGVRVYAMELDPEYFNGVGIHDEQAHTSGGLMWHPTPTGYQESSVIGAPYIESTATAGGLLTGDFGYRAVWETADGFGKKIRSTVSPLHEESGLFLNQVTLTVTAPRFGLASAENLMSTVHTTYQLALYRTDASGSIFYLHSRTPCTAGRTVSIVDNTVTLDRSETLTHGIQNASLGPTAPPASLAAFKWRDRLCVISAEDDTIWYSMPLVPERGAEFNEVLVFQVPGRPIGGGQLNNNLVVFGENGIHVCSGTLADAAGAGQNVLVQEVSTSIGCIDARSILRTNKGIYFQSERGLELLTKDYGIERVRGADSILREDDRRITDAAYDPVTSDILFTTNDDSQPKLIRVNETNGNVSVDVPSNTFLNGIWSLKQHPVSTSGFSVSLPPFPKLLRGTITDGTSKGDDANGEIVIGGRPDSLKGSDDLLGGDLEILPVYTTPWFAEDGPQGFQQVEDAYLFLRMGSEGGTQRANIRISQFYDHSDTALTTDDYTISPSSDVDAPGVVKIRLMPVKPLCSAIRFSITYDAAASRRTFLKLISLRMNIAVVSGGSRVNNTVSA